MRSVSLLLLLSVGVGGNALAQQSVPLPAESPTRGPEIPVPVLAGDADATQVVLDAANTGFLKSWNAVALYSYLDRDGRRGPGGFGLYLASPLPYLDQLVVGASVELPRPPDSFPYRDEANFSLSLAWRPLRLLSFGVRYLHVFTGETPGTSGLDTLDLSAAARLGSYVAAAFVVHDVAAPMFLGLPVQRVYQPELAVRPFGNDWLEIAASVRVGERHGVDPMVRIVGMPYRGLLLRAGLEWVRDADGDRHIDADLRATVGLEVDFSRFGFGGYALFGSAADLHGVAAHGFAATVRLSGERYPSIHHPTRLWRVDLTGGGDRQITALVAQLRRWQRDGETEGVLIVMGDAEGSWATMEELRQAFRGMRTAGKHVFVYGAELSTKTYYAAAAAERIFLDPSGGIRFVGLSSTGLYFKGTLDLLSVKAEFVKIAEYKSAPEQFTREGPSEDAHMVKAAILDDINGRLLAAVAADRKVDGQRAMALRDNGPYTAQEALQNGLVDELKHGDEIEDAIGKLVGHDVQATPRPAEPARPRRWSKPAVAVIYIDGDIVQGKSRVIPFLGMRFAGHETIIHAIEEARSDDRVKAIVLRIDSPGGSALASDLMARELARTKKVKPLVCSMGDVAASGGYFVAAPCDRIFADPSTITGSIGIFTGKFDLSGLATRLGVGIEVEKRGPHADMESLYRSYTPEERAMLLEKLKYYYGRFLDTVAEGRHMKRDEVDAVARGRVWTGAQAKDKKLVDELGGFEAALADARHRGGLGADEEIDLIAYPEERTTLLGQLLQLVGIKAPAMGLEAIELPAMLVELFKALPASLVVAPSTPQARLPFSVIFR